MRIHFQKRPYDLLAVGLLTGAMAGAFLTMGPLRIALGLILVLLLPGYTLVAALFPSGNKLDWIERLVLSFGLSIAVVSLLGLVLNFSPWGIRPVPVMITLTTFIGGVGFLAYARRMRLPAGQRMELTIEVVLPPWSQYAALDKVLIIGLVLALVLAGGALAYVLTVPRPAERFTDFYLLGPDGKAGGYPTNLTAGSSGAVIVGVVNHEGLPADYTLVVTLEEYNVTVNSTGTQVRTLISSSPVNRYIVPLQDGAKAESNLTFTVPKAGLFRLELQLYLGGATSAYRELHLWLRVRG